MPEDERNEVWDEGYDFMGSKIANQVGRTIQDTQSSVEQLRNNIVATSELKKRHMTRPRQAAVSGNHMKDGRVLV